MFKAGDIVTISGEEGLHTVHASLWDNWVQVRVPICPTAVEIRYFDAKTGEGKQFPTQYIKLAEISTPAPEPTPVEMAHAQMTGATETRALRYNSLKPHLSYVPTDAIEAESWVWTAGRKKYPREERNATMQKIGNWEKLWGDDTAEIALDCALRHIQKIQQGEWTEVQKDRDGNIIYHDDGVTPVVTQHAAAVRCNMAILIRYYNTMIAPALRDDNEDKNATTVD